ncbi:glycerate kinase [Nesterenkonia sp. HG001]|uniref:glycerate kinase n=1 Tax=Nesterenkonia sp. HG001 TaxID=2983207 RepID=UPI002AC4B36F|nr:glycerate kinase [Nesterenkonia sp. HG001]MDZ5078941.1 glycerate kinase [Nesterenkonia sp. HG001]
MAQMSSGGAGERIVIAPDTFKGSLSAREVAAALAAGFRNQGSGAVIEQVPMADGGEGTLDAVAEGGAAGDWTIEVLEVTGPDGRPVGARLGTRPGDAGPVALVELAEASGLGDMDPCADPLRATSRGTGELLCAALDRGAREVVLALGGSACTDAGAGLLSALGARLLDRAGRRIPDGAAGLAGLAAADLSGLDPRLGRVRLVIAADVDSPLIGPRGAAEVFGPQKGLDERQVRQAAAALRSAVPILAEAAYRRGGAAASERVVAAADQPGAGAAGGVGFATLGLLGGARRPGVEVVMDLVGLEAKIASADLVITGEGSLDTQSLAGKVPVGVAACASRHGVPVIAVCGRNGLDRDQWAAAGLEQVWALRDLAADERESMTQARDLLHTVGSSLAIDPARRRRRADRPAR